MTWRTSMRLPSQICIPWTVGTLSMADGLTALMAVEERGSQNVWLHLFHFSLDLCTRQGPSMLLVTWLHFCTEL